MVTKDSISTWLIRQTTETPTLKYRHSLLTETIEERQGILPALKKYFYKAHEDARRRLTKPFEKSLDPFGENAEFDPAEGYPHRLHQVTLQGYFGEVFASLIARFFDPFGISGWEVPGFLFRFHTLAFEQLDALRHNDKKAKPIPGRSGDDCLAFYTDEKGNVLKILYCESKCTLTHRTDLITDAHEKVGSSEIVSIRQLIELLDDYEDDNSIRWSNSLKRLLMNKLVGCDRYNLVNYICGQLPKRDPSWMSRNTPHNTYKSNHHLEAVELHISGVAELIDEVYRKPYN